MRDKDYLFIGFITILAAITLLYGTVQIGNPFAVGERKIDQKRVIHMSKLKYQIEEYYRKNSKLPPTINDIDAPSYNDNSFSKKDPQTSRDYEYTIVNDRSYKLCATFTTDTINKKDEQMSNNDYAYESIKSQYQHPKGYYCFNFDIPDFLTPLNTNPTGVQQTTVTSPTASLGQCVDSDGGGTNLTGDKIFTKGTATLTSSSGVVTTKTDKCDSTNTAMVVEVSCLLRLEGNLVLEERKIACEKGCVDGACLQ